MKNFFFSSDHHLFHKNILKFEPENRPFADVDEMNEAIIERNNEVVKPDDDLYLLGDFSWRGAQATIPLLERMNGNKYFIFGNHDKPMKSPEMAQYFEWMKDYYFLTIDNKYRFVLFHYPIYSWNGMRHGVFHLYGHTHSKLPALVPGLSMNVGLDLNNCYPYNLEEILQQFAEMNVEPFDTRMQEGQ